MNEKLKTIVRLYINFTCAVMMMATILVISVQAQEVISPPELGQETKGQPAVSVESPEQAQTPTLPEIESTDETKADNILGNTKITELKRESGQVYMIELEHSSGSKQYIQETDSDGKIESTSNDIEETPNLPKWKLGSW